MFKIGDMIKAVAGDDLYTITTGPRFLGRVIGLNDGRTDDIDVLVVEASDMKASYMGSSFDVASEHFILAVDAPENEDEQTLEELVEENESLGEQINALTVRLEKKKAYFANNRTLILAMIEEAV